MSIKIYEYIYDCREAYVKFKIDTKKITPDKAQALLDFFIWSYDLDAPPLDEIMKKYAIKAIEIATFESYNEYGVKCWFEETEGFIPLDGSHGIELINVIPYEFDENSLNINIKDF